MSKPKSEDLNHVLLVREGGQQMFSQRGKDKLDLILNPGVPEPISNFVDAETADKFVEQNVCIYVNANGTMENGKRHPSVVLKGETVSDPLPDTAATAPTVAGVTVVSPAPEAPAPTSSEGQNANG